MLISLYNCGQTKALSFSTYTFISAGKKEKFAIEIPKGYIDVNQNLDNALLKEYVYPDGSILYISLDISYSDSPNKRNWSKCSNPKTGYKCEEGEQDNGLFWKEIFKNNLVLGYLNIPKPRKLEFDKAIASLVKK